MNREQNKQKWTSRLLLLAGLAITAYATTAHTSNNHTHTHTQPTAAVAAHSDRGHPLPDILDTSHTTDNERCLNAADAPHGDTGATDATPHTADLRIPAEYTVVGDPPPPPHTFGTPRTDHTEQQAGRTQPPTLSPG